MRRSRGNTTVEARVNMEPDAAKTLARIAEPYLRDCAKTIGESIVDMVPVQSGEAKKTYRPTVDDGDTPGEVLLRPNSPFWHWLEYGTATSPVYRPVGRGVEASGARWEPM